MENVIQASNFILNIKKEPLDETFFDSKIENHKVELPNTKSLVLKFVKDKNGCYSVVPLIKPDPFFEEILEDLTNDNSVINIKSEKDQVNSDKFEDFNIQQEETEEDDKASISKTGAEIRDGVQERNNNFPTVLCPTCFYRDEPKYVKKHMKKVHSSSKKYMCPFCHEKNFKEPISLDYHLLRNHQDAKGALDLILRTIFECSFCNYKTLKRNNFTRHLTTHGDSRLKQRLKAKKGEYSLGGNHSKHDLKRALDTTKYDCYYCPYRTKDKGSIVKHVRLHRAASQLPFSCKGCNKKFNEKNSLDSHILKRHINEPELLQVITNRVYGCESCNYKDVNKNKVLRHEKAKHVKKARKRKEHKNENFQ